MDLQILIPISRLKITDLERFRNAPFENMIKFTVDIRLRKIALGGEMHADSEEVLLGAGSGQADIWGGEPLAVGTATADRIHIAYQYPPGCGEPWNGDSTGGCAQRGACDRP